MMQAHVDLEKVQRLLRKELMEKTKKNKQGDNNVQNVYNGYLQNVRKYVHS